MTKTREIELSNSDDLIDVRDVIERIEQLEELEQPGPVDTGNPADATVDQDDLFAELVSLRSLLENLRGNGGDEQYKGDWYPITLVRDSFFKDFAHDEAESLDLIKNDAQWPYTCIDWDQAASELQMDYASVEFDGVTYWYR